MNNTADLPQEKQRYWAAKTARLAMQAANVKPAVKYNWLYEATFQKYEEWQEHMLVDGKLVTINKKGYRTYSTGPYVAGRNKLKRTLKVAQTNDRRSILAWAPRFGIRRVPKIKLTMKGFAGA